MSPFLVGVVLLVVIGGALIAARAGCGGWLGLPVAFLLVRMVIDTTVSPLLSPYVGYQTFPFSGVAGEAEIPGAVALIVVSYTSVLGGMLLARMGIPGEARDTYDRFSVGTLPGSVIDRGWRAAVLVFALGAVANGLVLLMLLREVSLLDIASKRAVFTAGELLSSRAFSYARLLGPSMQVGAIGMVVFGGLHRRRMRYWMLALGATLLVQAVFGGRGGTTKVVLAAAVVFHYGVRAIRPKEAVGAALALVAGLAYIAVARYGQSEWQSGVLAILRGTLINGNIHDAAFALRAFPGQIEFFRGATVLAGFTHIVPEFPVPGAKNLWLEMMHIYYRGENVMEGIGGGNFALAAEHYMNFGTVGVVLFGMAFGLVMGAIFEWQRNNRGNPFLLILTTQTLLAFISGVESRAAQSLGGLAMTTLLPTGILAALVLPSTFVARGLLTAGYAALWCFVAYRLLSGSTWALLFRAALFAQILLFYFFALHAIRRGRWLNSNARSGVPPGWSTQ